uniref:Lipoprotein n=2 Tax=Vibrionaceae TaxID=641 RepID=A0A0H3ZRX0_VIBSP|nr:hypothetical protein [Vibrio splendidus]AKN40559.1 hypothetical protein [Enterovibrio norvegicus]
MKNIILLAVFTFGLSGCASPTQNTDTKNSPCACNYNGKPLTIPSHSELIDIHNEIKAVS